jgi:hypothetical protein
VLIGILSQERGEKNLERGSQMDCSLEVIANSDSSGGNEITLVNFE